MRPFVHVDVIPNEEFTVMLHAFVDLHVTPPIIVALNTKTGQYSARRSSESDVIMDGCVWEDVCEKMRPNKRQKMGA